MEEKIKVNVNSEIGELEAVIIHSPGPELENMNPSNAERALYSDILNLAVASREYDEFRNVLSKLTRTFEVNDLLEQTISDPAVKDAFIRKILKDDDNYPVLDNLMKLDEKELTRQVIEGVPLIKNNLTKFLSNERYILQPLHNFFFTRDASVSIGGNVLISRMASKIREREAMIMETVFDHNPLFETKTYNPANSIEFDPNISIEGGDIIVASEDTILVGIGNRTTSQGIDYLLEKNRKRKTLKNIIVQELPSKPESFIHLDMVFTFLDRNLCMIYEPVIMNPNKFRTVHISIENGEVAGITEGTNIPDILRKIGWDIETVNCGGKADIWVQEREQWHSGANFFAVGPGKLLGYGRNIHTIEEINKKGYEIIKASDVIKERVNPLNYDKFVITIKGSELSRGGGGCRCMTMPVSRKPI